jgi:hypothetical protein
MSRCFGIGALVAIFFGVASVANAQEMCVQLDEPPVQACTPPCWFTAEYLHYYIEKRQLPVLLTTGSVNDLVPGALGQPNTRPLLGGIVAQNDTGTVRTNLIDNMQSGMRLGLGWWLNDSRTVSLEGSFMWLFEQDSKIRENSTGEPGSRLIARPFFNANTNMEDADPVAIPNIMAGEVTVSLPRQVLGSEINLRITQPESIYSLGRVSYLFGFRHLSLQEGLRYSEMLHDVEGLGQPGNVFMMDESFRASNHFYGGQFGLGYVGEYGPFRLDVLGKVALGVNNQTVKAHATTQVLEPNGTLTGAIDRGLLVQPSNAGSSTNNELTVLPEFNANFSYELNPYIRLTVGYSILYWPTVIHPERQIDPVVNMQAIQPRGQVGIARPAPINFSEDIWLQGVSLGVQFSF